VVDWAVIPAQAARTVELTERDAWRSFCEACPPALARKLGLVVETLDSILVTSCAALDHPLLNRVTGLGIEEPATPELLDSALAVLRANGSRSFHVYVSPAAEPAAAWTSWLEARGLVRHERFHKLLRDTAPAAAAPAELELRPAGAEAAAALGSAVCDTYGLPAELAPWFGGIAGRDGWRVHASWDRGEIVSFGALALVGDTGWLGVAGTAPSHRRRGAQRALVARRIADAAAAGCAWVCSETPEPPLGDPSSLGNLVRAGFRIVYERPSWGPPT
jgi:GNAT superfamily N-acetyltransferase